MNARLIILTLVVLAFVSTTAQQPTSVERSVSSSSISRARSDANSLLAHQQLVQKAKRGGIDVYFLGDSITRRWGAADPQYRPLLENWNTNFFGWNAANFGWGADRIENILWRVQNGELDGVNPKVIVLLAGINNLGAEPGGAEKIEDITHGFRTLVDACQAKAPEATVIVTAIFPRNDNLAVMPMIVQINRNIAGIADGRKIRYLDINDKLADREGRLLPGMMNADQLHPTVKAYQLWADALKPLLTELLGPPAKTDHAPPPTGDPSAVVWKTGFDKDTAGAMPAGWAGRIAGDGNPKWSVEKDASAPSTPFVLKQSGWSPNPSFPLCTRGGSPIKDGFVEVKFKALSGTNDQAAGLVWRVQDENNYYVVRANALEGNVVLYKVENGKRKALEIVGRTGGYGVAAKVPLQRWSTLRVNFVETHFCVFLNGENLFAVEDATFSEPGAVGVWTKADSVVLFDDFACSQ